MSSAEPEPVPPETSQHGRGSCPDRGGTNALGTQGAPPRRPGKTPQVTSWEQGNRQHLRVQPPRPYSSNGRGKVRRLLFLLPLEKWTRSRCCAKRSAISSPSSMRRRRKCWSSKMGPGTRPTPRLHTTPTVGRATRTRSEPSGFMSQTPGWGWQVRACSRTRLGWALCHTR